jgi:hypothetical protein
MTRWQGTIIGIGLRPFAAPTARTAFGLPIRSAISEYDDVSPYGIFCSASSTLSWNSVPLSFSARSKSRRSPAKYSVSCWRAAANGFSL